MNDLAIVGVFVYLAACASAMFAKNKGVAWAYIMLALTLILFLVPTQFSAHPLIVLSAPAVIFASVFVWGRHS